MSRPLKIGGACLNQIPIDWNHNVTNIKNAIDVARDEEIDILCLPELCLTGYGCEDLFLSEWLVNKSKELLSELIPFTAGITTTIGLPYNYDGKLYNCIAILSDGELLGFFAKHNLANDGVHYEHRWFSPWKFEELQETKFGDKNVPFGAFEFTLEDVKIGFEICEDAWKEERPLKYCQNLDLVLNPSASHFAFGKETIRENLVISSSETYQCTYLYANLVGNEAGRMIYDGDIIIASQGKLIGHNRRFSYKNLNVLSIEIDFDNLSATKPNIKSDYSGANEEFSAAAPLALFDYCRKSRSEGFVLSLSGGADSGTIAILVAQMVRNGVNELGIDGFIEKIGISFEESDRQNLVHKLLTTAYQGSRNSSEQTYNSAKELAEGIGANFLSWEIDDVVISTTSKVEKALKKSLNWTDHDIALQNIQARSRSPIIWMVANLKKALLLTTSNRSEGDLGYATMDGDTSGSISPIAAVDKYFIRNWLKYAEEVLGYDCLKKVNSLQPTAELRPSSSNQTDESDLMPYEVIVKIERLAIRDRKSPIEVFKELEKEFSKSDLKNWISKFYRLWSQNQWKRERIAPSFHLDDFNVDPRTWCRFPILSGSYREELEDLRLL